MKFWYIIWMAAVVHALPLQACAVSHRAATDVSEYDVVVYGASSAGFIAAIQAAQHHVRVALIEPTGHLGGMNIEGLGGTDIDNHGNFQNSPAVGGLALEFYRRIANAYGRLEEFEAARAAGKKNASLWRFEPHVAAQVIQDWLAEYAIDIYRNTYLLEDESAVEKVNTSIRQIRVNGNRSFRAKVFIDASVEGDLMFRAGVGYTVGREANALYGEKLNGNRPVTTHAQFQVAVDPYRTPGDPLSGLIPTIQDEVIGEEGAGDSRIQAFCFRMCLTNVAQNRLPFTRPANYDRGLYEIYLRYLRAGGKLYVPGAYLPGHKTDLGAWHDLSHNLYGMNHDYPEAGYARRAAILQAHRNFTQGLFYFLSHDAEVGQLDPNLQQEWRQWGLPKDEFTDNDGWPRMFYVRDGRRMVSDYVVTEHHIKRTDALAVDDPVAIAYWPPDVHSVRRIVKDGRAYNEGFVFGGDWWKPFGISYRAIVPKSSECTNLLVPSCPSSSHIAYGGIRIEFTFMALGQAAADAAILALHNQQHVQEVDYQQLRSRLQAGEQVLSLEY